MSVESTGLTCNIPDCDGKIQWLTYQEQIANPLGMAPPHTKTIRRAYCETCGVQYEPEVIIRRTGEAQGPDDEPMMP